ncbi:MAG TPA: hypothetical protein PKC80_06980 [Burkholderiaceae bacterium]|nr:hypothetical protein [Burkholderiaceae bacterium]
MKTDIKTTTNDHQSIIFSLYDAVGKEGAWNAVLQTLCEHLNASIRSQSSSIFAKTGTTRQQELIRLLGSLPTTVQQK